MHPPLVPPRRGTIPRLHVEELSVSARPSISRGFLAVFSSEKEGAAGGGGGSSLGQASGGGGLAWRDGVIHDLRLGGTTVLEGDLDVGGYRLLNFNVDSPVADELEDLTILRTLRLEAHASLKASVLSLGAKGEVIPADPLSLALVAASLSASGLVEARELACRGTAEIEGRLAVGGGLSLGGELELGGGIDARGTRISNAYFGNASFRGPVLGDVAVEGTLKVGALDRRKGGRDTGAPSGETSDDPEIESSTMVSHLAPVVTAGMGGELRVARGVKYDEDADLFVVPKISGHEVTGPVDFAGQLLYSPQVDFSSGGGIDGLGSLSVGGEGLDVGGPLRAGSDVIVDGSLTVAGAVMGRGPYMDSSDLRLKTDVTSIPGRDASDIVRALRGVTYVFDADAAPSARRGVLRGRQYGFIAQEVEDVVPEIVSEDAQGFKVVAYARLVPVLTAALSLAYDRLDIVERNVAVSAPTVIKASVASGRSNVMEEPCSATRLARSKRPEYAENAIARMGKAPGIFRRGYKGWGSEEAAGALDHSELPPDLAQGAVVYGKRSELKAGDVPFNEEAGCDDVAWQRRLARENVELHDTVDALRERLHELERRIEALETRRAPITA